MNIRDKAQELVELGEGKQRGELYPDIADVTPIARKLIEALDTIQAMCDSADRYEAHARAHPERDHALAWANGAGNAVTVGRFFLAMLDERGDGDE